jgi:hypothetical protein
MLEAARGLLDLLKARRDALEARRRGEMARRNRNGLSARLRDHAVGMGNAKLDDRFAPAPLLA